MRFGAEPQPKTNWFHSNLVSTYTGGNHFDVSKVHVLHQKAFFNISTMGTPFSCSGGVLTTVSAFPRVPPSMISWIQREPHRVDTDVAEFLPEWKQVLQTFSRPIGMLQKCEIKDTVHCSAATFAIPVAKKSVSSFF